MSDARHEDAAEVLAVVAAHATAQLRGENFPVALRVLPREARTQLTRVYTFARFVDDVGDEAPGDRTALLTLIREQVLAQHAGTASDLAAVRDLGPLFAAGVAVQPCLDLIAANLVDQRVYRYDTFADLLGYCALSAAPVGQIVLQLAGAATPANVAASDAACAALQVLEHCQDVREDAVAGRVYLAAAELAAAGLPSEQQQAALAGADTPPAARLVVARNVERATRMLRESAPLVGNLSGWARLAVAGFVAGGMATADALADAHFDVLARDVRPGRRATMRHAVGLLIARRP